MCDEPSPPRDSIRKSVTRLGEPRTPLALTASYYRCNSHFGGNRHILRGLPDSAHLARKASYTCMTACFDIERKSARTPLDVFVQILRADGTRLEGRCVDASDQGFGISLETSLEMGEVLRLTIGRRRNAPSFTSRVVWQNGQRVGLLCVASND